MEVLRRSSCDKSWLSSTSCLLLDRVPWARTCLFVEPVTSTWICSEVISIISGSWPTVVVATKAILQRARRASSINPDELHFALISCCMSEFPLSQSSLQDFCFPCSIWRLGDRKQGWSSCSASLGRKAARVSWMESSAGLFQPWARGWNSGEGFWEAQLKATNYSQKVLKHSNKKECFGAARWHRGSRHLLPGLRTRVVPWDLKGGGREPDPTGRPLISTCIPWHAYSPSK